MRRAHPDAKEERREGEERDELESLENATMRGDKCCNREYEVPLTPVAFASPGHGFREKVRLVVEPYVIYTGYRCIRRPLLQAPSRAPLRGVAPVAPVELVHAINFAAENPA